MNRAAILLLLSFSVAACSALPPTGTVIPYAARDWRTVATDDDRERLRDWRDAFVAGLKAARAAGHSDSIAREGALLEPDSALGGAPIPNGNYRCRVIKLGAKSSGLLDYVSYPPFACRIRQERDLQGFAKLTGSQRHVGLIFPGTRNETSPASSSGSARTAGACSCRGRISNRRSM
jgi:hypothetical protein